MSEDDPFRPRDSTIIKPAPGGRGRRADMADMDVPGGEANYAGIGHLAHTGANVFLAAATPLLAMAGQLRRSISYEDPKGLFPQLAQEVRAFEAEARTSDETPEDVGRARYIICGFVDEAILNTPWGRESDWASRTLLAEFYGDVDAGERVFELLDRIKLDPARYLHLLELLYVCLSLGFQGRYRHQDRGYDALEEIRAELYSLISRQRGPTEHELSPRWRGVSDLRPKLARYVPLWLVLVIASTVLIGVYTFAWYTLYKSSEPVITSIASLSNEIKTVAPPRIERARITQPSLTELLRSAIEDGRLDSAGDNTVVLRGLFPSASAEVSADYFGLLREISTALNAVKGRVVVAGHTDNNPIRTLRFPSNWKLSEERAASVVKLLELNQVDSGRMLAEARADTEPVCRECDQNASEERALNRRVEISLQRRASRD